jgi:hypothetical protein
MYIKFNCLEVLGVAGQDEQGRMWNKAVLMLFQGTISVFARRDWRKPQIPSG